MPNNEKKDSQIWLLLPEEKWKAAFTGFLQVLSLIFIGVGAIAGAYGTVQFGLLVGCTLNLLVLIGGQILKPDPAKDVEDLGAFMLLAGYVFGGTAATLTILIGMLVY